MPVDDAHARLPAADGTVTQHAGHAAVPAQWAPAAEQAAPWTAAHFWLPPALAHRIWHSPDVMLLLFAGSAAEFAVNKAVDWLFFTNVLPQAPIERFFETVAFGQILAFGDEAAVQTSIARVTRMHAHVEARRGARIPSWAYRDVLFFALDYTERGYTIVYGAMTPAEREAHFRWWMTLGRALQVAELPTTYADYRRQRHVDLAADIAHTVWTDRLYGRYRAVLGPWRAWMLRQVQASLVPEEVRAVLGLRVRPAITLLLRLYRYVPGGGNKLRWFHGILLPRGYRRQLAAIAAGPAPVPARWHAGRGSAEHT